MNKLYGFISSLKFCIILLLLVTLVSLAGVIIPQGLDAGLYINKWGTVGGSLLLSIGFDTLFSTVWYNILLGVFALNTLLCTINRMKVTFFSLTRSRFLSAGQIGALTLHRVISFSGTSDEVIDVVSSFFKKRRYSLKSKSEDGCVHFDTRRGLFREIGYALLHLSLIPILAGGLVGKMTGFSYVQKLSGGEQAAVRERPFFVRCDFFELERNDNGMIKDYKSGLTILDSTGDSLAGKVIEVNHPLVYKGIKIYQSSYQADAMNVRNVELVVNGPLVGSIGKKVVLGIGDSVLIDGTALKLYTGIFMPDFMFDMETKKARNRSMRHNNPALFVTIVHDGDTLLSRWVFQRFSSMHHKDDAYSVAFMSYDQQMSTGLLVKENPGGVFIWFGIIFMCIGVVLVFWVPRRRFFISLVDTTLHIGAAAPKDDPEQRDVFRTVAEQLEARLREKNCESHVKDGADATT